MKAIKFLFLPLATFTIIVLGFFNSKLLEFRPFIMENGDINTNLIKLLLMIFLPMIIIFSLKELKAKSGLYFENKKDSALLSWTCFYLLGPACIGFPLIGLLGFSFKDWGGSIILSGIFLIVLYFIPKITKTLPTVKEADKGSLKGIISLISLSILTVTLSLFSFDENLIFFKVLYFFFIVGVGEEILFRGYLQSSFNLYFGKKFKFGDVTFGWGLILSAILFGLIHSIAPDPPVWPWMLFTFAIGLILGYVREKSGSLLAPIMLHILIDFPLIFMS